MLLVDKAIKRIYSDSPSGKKIAELTAQSLTSTAQGRLALNMISELESRLQKAESYAFGLEQAAKWSDNKAE